MQPKNKSCSKFTAIKWCKYLYFIQLQLTTYVILIRSCQLEIKQEVANHFFLHNKKIYRWLVIKSTIYPFLPTYPNLELWYHFNCHTPRPGPVEWQPPRAYRPESLYTRKAKKQVQISTVDWEAHLFILHVLFTFRSRSTTKFCNASQPVFAASLWKHRLHPKT
jgi:hypothetical protein